MSPSFRGAFPGTIALASVLMLVSVALGACGSGDGDSDADAIRPIEGTVIADLPPEWPGDFPVMPDSRFEEAVVNPNAAGGPSISATWRTDGGIEDVTAFFDAAFAAGPWVSEGAGDIGGTATWVATSQGSPYKALVSLVERTSGDGEVEIVVLMGPASE